ncbi:unnamed protein product [Closterium sp. Yama58-4]|nr:unnamed protein product [Closterium sp. Yama58-4]
MESDLQLETAVLGKLLRQNRSQHRHGKYFHALRQLHRRLRDFFSSNVLHLLQDIKAASPPALLAVAQSPELDSQSRRVVFSLQYIQETTSLLIRAARLIAGLVILERFLPLCVTSFACLGRLYILLLQCQLHHVSAYNRLTATAARGKVLLPPSLPPRLYHVWQASTLLISSRPFPSPDTTTSGTSSTSSSSSSSSSSKKNKKVKIEALERTADALIPTQENVAAVSATLAPVAAVAVSPAAPGERGKLATEGVFGSGEAWGGEGMAGWDDWDEGFGGDDGYGGREEGMGRGEDDRREGGEDGEMDSEEGREESEEGEGEKGEIEEGKE